MTIDGEQLTLALGTWTCPGCEGLRVVNPPFSGMEPEPCILCCEAAWDRWMLDPYGLRKGVCLDCGARLHADAERCDRCWRRRRFSFWRMPERVGQLGLGLGF